MQPRQRLANGPVWQFAAHTGNTTIPSGHGVVRPELSQFLHTQGLSSFSAPAAAPVSAFVPPSVTAGPAIATESELMSLDKLTSSLQLGQQFVFGLLKPLESHAVPSSRSRLGHEPLAPVFVQDLPGDDSSVDTVSIVCLIGMVLLSSPAQCLSISDIYKHLESRFPYFATAGPSWKNTVRHSLSLSKYFCKLPPTADPAALGDAGGKGSLWGVRADARAEIEHALHAHRDALMQFGSHFSSPNARAGGGLNTGGPTRRRNPFVPSRARPTPVSRRAGAFATPSDADLSLHLGASSLLALTAARRGAGANPGSLSASAVPTGRLLAGMASPHPPHAFAAATCRGTYLPRCPPPPPSSSVAPLSSRFRPAPSTDDMRLSPETTMFSFGGSLAPSLDQRFTPESRRGDGSQHTSARRALVLPGANTPTRPTHVFGFRAGGHLGTGGPAARLEFGDAIGAPGGGGGGGNMDTGADVLDAGNVLLSLAGF